MRHALGTPWSRRAALSAADLLWFLIITILLIAVLLPSLSRARELAKRAVCASNLRSMGQGMHIYANDYKEWFPTHYFEAREDDENVPPVHGVRWVGTMGTNDFLSIAERTSAKTSPTRSHPSRSLFLLITYGLASPGSFVCPSSWDSEDTLHNYGPDASNDGQEERARPGLNRFDFAGYDRLSYGYQLPYGQRGKPRETLDLRMVIGADKGPFYARGGAGVAGTRTVHDRLSGMTPRKGTADELIGAPRETWRRYNSRNHGGEGQNVLYLDAHADFIRTPLNRALGFDNVYTIQSGFNQAGAASGTVPDADTAIGPLANTDSFLVP